MRRTISDDYITGFVDGEGCFALSVRRDIRHERASKATYYSWKAMFVISLRADDSEILEKIQERLGVGKITYNKNCSSVRFQVSDLFDQRDVIIPFFKKNFLHGKKRKDFELWAEAVTILLKYKNARGNVNIEKGKRGFQKVVWDEGDIQRLQEIQDLSSGYKSRRARRWKDAVLGREEENKLV